MINQGKTELRFWLKDGVEVGPAVKGAKELIVGPGSEIPANVMNEERLSFYTKAGIVGGDFEPRTADTAEGFEG
jgi:hypothetical protein